jgi:putative transposase
MPTRVLDASQFKSIQKARQASEAWRLVYNEQRAHSDIGRLPPKAFKQRLQQRQSLLMTGNE